MADYYSMARTNHFAVKDSEAFALEVSRYIGDNNVLSEKRDGIDGFILLFDEGIPSEYYDYEDDNAEPIDLDWEEIISKHLADGEVCVIQEIGNEKLRYLTGYAVAFNNRGQRESISIDRIYDKAKTLGTRITEAEY